LNLQIAYHVFEDCIPSSRLTNPDFRKNPENESIEREDEKKQESRWIKKEGGRKGGEGADREREDE